MVNWAEILRPILDIVIVQYFQLFLLPMSGGQNKELRFKIYCIFYIRNWKGLKW